MKDESMTSAAYRHSPARGTTNCKCPRFFMNYFVSLKTIRIFAPSFDRNGRHINKTL